MKKHINYTQYASKNLPKLHAKGQNRTVRLQSLTPELWMILSGGQSVVVRRSGIVLRKTSAKTVRAALLPGCQWREIYACGGETGWYESVSKSGVISHTAQMYSDSGSKQGGIRTVAVAVAGRETDILVYTPGDAHVYVRYPVEHFLIEPGLLTHKNGWYIKL